MKVSIIIPTADPEAYPASHAISIAEKEDANVVTVVSSGPDFSYARSVNRGLEKAGQSDLYVLVNDDCFMDEGWLQAMVDFTTNHPHAGIVGAVLRYPGSDRIQHAGGWIALWPMEFIKAATRELAPFWAVRQILKRRKRLFPWMFIHYRRVDSGNRLDYVTGACMMFNQDVLRSLGKFDAVYTMGMEDVDFCLRALKQGFEIGLARGVTGTHFEGYTSGHLRREKEESVALFQEIWDPQAILDLTRHRNGVIA